MACEYVSSPVEHPGTQMRIGVMLIPPLQQASVYTTFFSASKASGSRKKLVTLMSKS